LQSGSNLQSVQLEIFQRQQNLNRLGDALQKEEPGSAKFKLLHNDIGKEQKLLDVRKVTLQHYISTY
jgi:hypothetical protein